MDASLQNLLAVVAGSAAGSWLLVIGWTSLRLDLARGRDDAALAVAQAGSSSRTANLLGVPLALVAAAAGSWYVIDGPASLAGDWWVGTAIGAWLVCFFGSTLMRGRHLATAVRLAGERSADDEDVQWRIRRVDLLSRGESLLLAVAIVVVALQPGPDAWG